jgi:uncharacterized protein (TIGR02001 family)
MKTLKLKTLALSLAVAGAASVSMVPAAAQAEVSYNAAVSNMYLWRGQDISNGQGVVSGGIDYSADNGLYAGVWASSENDGTETDLYGGYGMTSGDFGLNLAYWAYFYPSDGTKSSFDRNDGTLLSEYEVTLSYADLSLTTMIDTEETDNKYYSLNYGIGDFGLHAGMYDFKAANSDYTDYNVSYAATDNLSFTLSVAQGDGIADKNEKPMLNVAYGFTF